VTWSRLRYWKKEHFMKAQRDVGNDKLKPKILLVMLVWKILLQTGVTFSLTRYYNGQQRLEKHWKIKKYTYGRKWEVFLLRLRMPSSAKPMRWNRVKQNAQACGSTHPEQWGSACVKMLSAATVVHFNIRHVDLTRVWRESRAWSGARPRAT